MRISHPPVMPDSLLEFRQIELADIAAWYGYLSIPNVLEHTSWKLESAEELKPALASYHSLDPASPIRLVVAGKEDGSFIGTAGFHTISVAHRTAEIAYDFAPGHWGKGYATACCNAMLEWGFAERRYVRIQALALDTNLASIRVLEKCGFSLEGKLRNYRIVRGVPRDFWLYAKTAG